MFDVRFIQHDKLPQGLLDEIIKVKAVAWPYSYNQQCDWIKNNLKSSDIHVLLLDGEKVVAYLNLVEIVVQIDSTELSGFGVGNVCAIEKGKGWGRELLKEVNNYLLENRRLGLLFCKEKLVRFYIKSEWILLPNQRLIISNIGSQVYTFAYNAPADFNELKFQGTPF
jgi:hypothetical protein